MSKQNTEARKAITQRLRLDEAYDPHGLEADLYQYWEQTGLFAPPSSSVGKATTPAYCIMLPPPNVTGSLHMGHAFQDTLMDALIRLHRMQGERVLWQGGTDHAGIATQMVVERQLQAEGRTRHDLGREEFIRRVWDWKAHSGGTITRQLRRMGAALDWTRERFTMDEGLSRAVTEVFVRLHDEGVIYRGKRLVNWDPVLHTAVSDLEVVSEEENGSLWHIRYPLEGDPLHALVVATTRPETLLGDAAVAVHPEDERYRHLIGRKVVLPLTGRTLPIIGDDYVDRTFGSGCVKITPAHDFNDYEVAKRHGLPEINILTVDAKIRANGESWRGAHASEIALPAAYAGLDRFEARKRIVADLEAAGLLEKTAPHKLMVPRGDRSGAVIEPFLTDQWYVRVGSPEAPGSLAFEAMRAVEDGRIRFVPDNWRKTYYEWMRNIQDWCISRQIWWGHRIPAWYDDDGQVHVGRNEAEVRAKHALGNRPLRQDEDVLDTWFSSALWPFSTLGWPENTAELKAFYPTSVLVTGFDIIFFWVARMIMMGLKFTGEVPFREVYIHGLVRDAHGQKMSKSKGNILDPIDLIDGIGPDQLVAKRTTGLMQPKMAKQIEQDTRKEFPKGIPAFGTDALRCTFASQATQGRDVKFDLGRIEGYRNFCNKLWNATRYVLMNTEGQDCSRPDATHGDTDSAADRWIRARLSRAAAEARAGFAEYRFDLATQALYRFVWDEYCSWYLELAKVTLTDPAASEASRRATRHTLLVTLESALRLLHPIMPFITEALWQRVAPTLGVDHTTILNAGYPQPDTEAEADPSVAELDWVMTLITAVRNLRGERDIPPGKRVPLVIEAGPDFRPGALDRQQALITALCKLETIQVLTTNESAPDSAMALAGQTRLHIPLGAFLDKQAELSRLAHEMEKTRKEIERAQHKLTNPDFRARAPGPVVVQEEGRLRDFEAALERLAEQQSRVARL